MRIEHTIQDGVHRYECWDDYGCSVVASAVVVEENDRVHLKDINVGSSYRGRGIGTTLLKLITEDFGDVELVAEVFEDRLPWYRRHGFEQVERIRNLTRVVRLP
jgi:ribosomal protein S18 acetylase RimI-like enzyme